MTVTPIGGVRYWYNPGNLAFEAPGRPSLPLPAPPGSTVYDYSAWNWSDTNVPYSTTVGDTASFMQGWPSGLTLVNLITGTGDFRLDLTNTLNSTSATKVVVVLPAGTQHIKTFQPYGTQSPTKPYLMGFYMGAKLQGLLGQGPLSSFVQLDANAYTTAQLDPLKTMTKASFAPLLNAMCRFDGTQAAPILLGGITFQGSDQPLLDTVASDVGAVVPQPAPYQGVTFYPGSYYQVNDCRFLATAQALISQPPFEMGCVSSQRCFGEFRRTEMDGRRAASINAARPRRCTVWMGNDEGQALHTDCWLHHSNVSRYAANDEGNSFGTSGVYTLTRTRIDHIADLQNVDPAQNGGASLDGYSDPSCAGWESCNAKITLNDCIIEQNNSHTTRAVPQHLSLTTTGRNAQGGRLTVNGGAFFDPGFPSVNGFLCVRASTSTFWVSDGLPTTMTVTSPTGVRKTARAYSGAWPPPSSFLSPLNPDTDFIVKTN